MGPPAWNYLVFFVANLVRRLVAALPRCVPSRFLLRLATAKRSRMVRIGCAILSGLRWDDSVVTGPSSVQVILLYEFLGAGRAQKGDAGNRSLGGRMWFLKQDPARFSPAIV